MTTQDVEISADDADVFDGHGVAFLFGSLGYQLRALNLTVARFVEYKHAETPVAGGTGKITTLLMIQNKPGISASEIAPYASKDAPGMTRMLDKLEQQGLLTREVDAKMRRRVRLYLTEAGEKLATQARIVAEQERELVFGMLSDEEHAQAVRILRKINDAYFRHSNRVPAWEK